MDVRKQFSIFSNFIFNTNISPKWPSREFSTLCTAAAAAAAAAADAYMSQTFALHQHGVLAFGVPLAQECPLT